MDDMLRKKIHRNDSIEMTSPFSHDNNTGMVRKKNAFEYKGRIKRLINKKIYNICR